MTEAVRVAGAGEIAPGETRLVEIGAKRIVVANVDGAFFAFSDECTHDGGPLSEGELEGGVLECPWHFSRFDVRTGAVVGSPADEPIATYEVRVDGGDVYVLPAGR